MDVNQYDNSDDATWQARRRRNTQGGSASVSPNDTLGEFGGCWCGEPRGHDWPGKDDGEPHPR